MGDETVPGTEAVRAPIDLAMLSGLGRVLEESTCAFESYDYARALERTEAFFWSFCDDYLELVKARAYEPAERPSPSLRAPPWGQPCRSNCECSPPSSPS